MPTPAPLDPGLLARARALARRYRRLPGWDREDLVQEAYIVMLACPAGSTDLDKWNRARAHLRTIARKARASVTGELPSSAADTSSPPPERAAEVAELLAWIETRLSPREAEILRARFWEGATDAQLGERLGISGVRVHLIRQRAVERLRDDYPGLPLA